MAESGARLLVSDDNKVNRLLLSRSLEMLGHRTAMAANGRIALEMLRRESFDLLLLDGNGQPQHTHSGACQALARAKTAMFTTGIGAACARRLAAAFGIPAEDDDGHAAAKTAPARRSAAPADQTRAKIDEAQWACLTQMIEAKGADTRKFCEWLGVESLKDIDACDFFRAKEALSKKADKAKPVEEIIADEVPY